MDLDYASSGDEDSAPAPSAAASTSAAPMLPQPASDDEGDDDFDSADAFGIAKISATAGPSTTSSEKAVAKVEAVKGSAPDVLVNDPSVSSTSLITRPSDSVIFFNSTYEDMNRPVEGPANPWSDRKMSQMNTLTGHVEQQAMSEQAFKTQQRSFAVLGYAANPSFGAEGYVGDLAAAASNGGDFIGDVKQSRATIRATKRRRKAKGTLGEFDDPDEEEDEAAEGAEGDDAEMEVGEDGEPRKRKKKEKAQKEYIGPWAGWEGENIATIKPTEEEWEEQAEKGGKPLTKKERSRPVIDAGKQIGFGEEKSTFHGKELHDYLGRSYLHIPTDVDVNLKPSEPGLQETFIPKKCIHTWSGHTKGVSKIQLFPGSGHLILSGSLDTRVKLWDVYNEGKCLRTFNGHTKAVHDVTFNNDGTKFLSAAFDRQMKLWDTETGQCLQAFSNGKIPYCVKFHPDKQNVFLAGMSDKKIIQYDMGSGEITQEYDQHLGPVNTINFVDDNRRFITTSDDKTIRVWDYDIPVVIKYIAEPSMHSMPAVGVHPNKKWLAMQSLDNQILIFGADSFKQNRKKRFAGHTIAGYACEPQFSPDGRFLSSGDGQGNMVFWDWKTCRIVSRFKAHNQVIISHAWLPHETSKVVTSSWDSSIKLWD